MYKYFYFFDAEIFDVSDLRCSSVLMDKSLALSTTWAEPFDDDVKVDKMKKIIKAKKDTFLNQFDGKRGQMTSSGWFSSFRVAVMNCV